MTHPRHIAGKPTESPREQSEEQEGTAATFDGDWSLLRVVERSDGVLLSVAERSQLGVGWWTSELTFWLVGRVMPCGANVVYQLITSKKRRTTAPVRNHDASPNLCRVCLTCGRWMDWAFSEGRLARSGEKKGIEQGCSRETYRVQK